MDPCTDDNTSTSRNGMMLDGLDCREKGLWKPPRGCLRLPSAPHKRSIWSMGAWKDGWFEVQDMGSQIIVQATEAIWGETIVDYCAGNGGKTLALASKMHDHKFQKRNQDICKNIAISATANFSSNDDFGDSGSNHSIIFAHDISDERIRQLQGSFQRAGIASSSKRNDGNDQCDGHHYHQQNIKIVTTANAKEDLFEQMADVVLVDAPCSSSGVLRRRPSQRWDIDPTEVHHALPALQLEILQNASKLVKPGGRLVYATCSILKWENENVVKEFEQQQQVSDDPNDGDLWIRWNFHDDNNECHSSSKLSEQAMDNSISLPHCKYLLPHCHNSDGFFIARWKKGF
jgi:16S rRNA (cytosine967-C5)-methyltransferase